MRKILAEKVCPNCQKLFNITAQNLTQTACSRSCVNAYRQDEKICKECGRKYRIKKSKSKTSVYCSKHCQSQWRSKNFTGKNASGYKNGDYTDLVEVECKVCGKSFKQRKVFIANGFGLICSPVCRSKAISNAVKNRVYKEKQKCICEVCGFEKILSPCFAKTFRFCSRKCRADWQSKRMKGENHPLWNGGESELRSRLSVTREYKNWRREVFTRDNYTCQKCGDKRGGNLNAHHIKPIATHPELVFVVENGLTVCRDCHTLIHQEMPSLQGKGRIKEVFNMF